MFEKQYKIDSGMCDLEGKLSPYGFFWLLNDIMEKNANSYGLGTDYHLARDLAWILVSYDVHIYDTVKNGDTVIAGTLPYAFKKMYGFRKYRFKDKNGNVLLKGKAKFVLVNIKTKALVKPPLDMLDKFTDAKKEPASLPFERIRLKKETVIESKTLTIGEDLIDVNGHVNNANYIKLATALIDHDITLPKRVRIEYKKEVFSNEQITVNLFEDSQTLKYISIMRDDACCAEIVFEAASWDNETNSV